MRCSRCGECCLDTEMLLVRADIERLENKGFSRNSFVRRDREGYSRLKNRQGHCVFYDANTGHCKVYLYRPLGCRLYPVIYDEEKGIVTDQLCPRQDTISKIELARRGKAVMRLLARIDAEAKTMRLLHKTDEHP
jgi:Fe-S-cluster containining protein